jgi:hypothetical protein
MREHRIAIVVGVVDDGEIRHFGFLAIFELRHADVLGQRAHARRGHLIFFVQTDGVHRVDECPAFRSAREIRDAQTRNFVGEERLEGLAAQFGFVTAAPRRADHAVGDRHLISFPTLCAPRRAAPDR